MGGGKKRVFLRKETGISGRWRKKERRGMFSS